MAETLISFQFSLSCVRKKTIFCEFSLFFLVFIWFSGSWERERHRAVLEHLDHIVQTACGARPAVKRDVGLSVLARCATLVAYAVQAIKPASPGGLQTASRSVASRVGSLHFVGDEVADKAIKFLGQFHC